MINGKGFTVNSPLFGSSLAGVAGSPASLDPSTVTRLRGQGFSDSQIASLGSGALSAAGGSAFGGNTALALGALTGLGVISAITPADKQLLGLGAQVGIGSAGISAGLLGSEVAGFSSGAVGAAGGALGAGLLLANFAQSVSGPGHVEFKPGAGTALGMARTFQVTSLFPKLTVLDNVLLAIKGLRPSKFVMWRFLSSYREVYDKAHGLLERANFLDRKDTEVRFLSHGEQRQLEIVLGLASDPKILLLDEPAAGLSSGESVDMTKFLMGLDPNLAILLIEHDMDVVFDVADQISVLHFGEVLETGAPEQIKQSKKVQEIYLGVE